MELKQHASQARSVALEFQRLMSAEEVGGKTRKAATEAEFRAFVALMDVALSAQSLYLREVHRCNDAALDRAEKANGTDSGRRGTRLPASNRSN